MEEEEITLFDEAIEELRFVQEFDTSTLVREPELGSSMCFKEAVPVAENIVSLFKKLSLSALDDFPDTQLRSVKTEAQNVRNCFEAILEFDLQVPDPTSVRTSLVNNLEKRYQPAFNVLHPFISYSLHKTADFSRLESEAREALNAIRGEAGGITKDLAKLKVDADTILEDVRKVAEEKGVGQQAIYFGNVSAEHEDAAASARSWTYYSAVAFFVLAVVSLFFVKIFPSLDPGESIPKAIQLVASKALLFGTLTFMLYHFNRSFHAHKHNAIVNRHRQNALLTYKALVDAAGDLPNREAVLKQAAACIFGSQPTGYASDGQATGQAATSVVEMLTKPIVDGEK